MILGIDYRDTAYKIFRCESKIVACYPLVVQIFVPAMRTLQHIRDKRGSELLVESMARSNLRLRM